MGQSRFKFWA